MNYNSKIIIDNYNKIKHKQEYKSYHFKLQMKNYIKNINSQNLLIEKYKKKMIN